MTLSCFYMYRIVVWKIEQYRKWLFFFNIFFPVYLIYVKINPFDHFALQFCGTTQPKYDELANCINCRYENYWRECFFLMHRHTIPKLAINENQNNHKFDYKSTVWSHLDISKHQFIQFTTQNWQLLWGCWSNSYHTIIVIICTCSRPYYLVGQHPLDIVDFCWKIIRKC
jgi:hypothetical protein